MSQFSDTEADPFLLFDEFGPADLPRGAPGAPWHPHRGFDTVTYIKQGAGRHADSMGNEGMLSAGDVQWMRAASGIVHDEGRDHPGGMSHGFQIWINLPRAMKMDSPHYEHILAHRLPFVPWSHYGSQKSVVKVIAGSLKTPPPSSAAVPAADAATQAPRFDGGSASTAVVLSSTDGTGPSHATRRDVDLRHETDGSSATGLPPLPFTSPLQQLAVPILYIDVEVAAGGRVSLPVPLDPYDSAFLYVYEGTARISNGAEDTTGVPVSRRDVVILAPLGEQLVVTCPAASVTGGAKFLLLAGRRINEPIARRGPFVMNTAEEIDDAFRDYQKGSFVRSAGVTIVHR